MSLQTSLLPGAGCYHSQVHKRAQAAKVEAATRLPARSPATQKLYLTCPDFRTPPTPAKSIDAMASRAEKERTDLTVHSLITVNGKEFSLPQQWAKLREEGPGKNV